MLLRRYCRLRFFIRSGANRAICIIDNSSKFSKNCYLVYVFLNVSDSAEDVVAFRDNLEKAFCDKDTHVADNLLEDTHKAFVVGESVDSIFAFHLFQCQFVEFLKQLVPFQSQE